MNRTKRNDKIHTPHKKSRAIISVFLVVAILIAGAYAFLSSTDSKTNVFTVGNVSIKLKENFDTDLSGVTEDDEKFDETVKTISLEDGKSVMPGQKIIKTPYIANTGHNPAWIYLTVGIPVANIDSFYKNADNNVEISGKDIDIPIVAYAIQDGYKNQTGYENIANVFFTDTKLKDILGELYKGSDIKKQLFNYLNDKDFANTSENKNSINENNWAQIGNVYETQNYNYYVFAYKTLLLAGESTENTALFKGVRLSAEIGEAKPAVINYYAESGFPDDYVLLGSSYSAIGEKLTLDTDYLVAKTGYTQKFCYENDTVAYTGDIITQDVTNLYGKYELIAKESIDTEGKVSEDKYLDYVIGWDATRQSPYAVVIGADSTHKDYPSTPKEVVVPATVSVTLNDNGTTTLSNGVFRGYLTGKTVNIKYSGSIEFENNIKPKLETFIADTVDGALVDSNTEELLQISKDYNKSELKNKLTENISTQIPVTTLSLAIYNLQDFFFVDDDSITTDPLAIEYANLIKIVNKYCLPDTIQNIMCSVPWWIENSDNIGIKQINIPANCTILPPGAFYGQSKLEKVIFNKTLTAIGENAFADCVNLTSIEIPKSVSAIGNSAFSGCSKLTSVTIPDSVTSIGYYAFEECNSLSNITYQGTVSNWTKIECPSNSFEPGLTITCIDGTVKT